MQVLSFLKLVVHVLVSDQASLRIMLKMKQKRLLLVVMASMKINKSLGGRFELLTSIFTLMEAKEASCL